MWIHGVEVPEHEGGGSMGDTSANTTLETTLAGTEGWTQGCLHSLHTVVVHQHCGVCATHGGG